MRAQLPALALASALLAACGGSTSSMSSGPAPNPDPRVGLKAGWMNAGEAVWNLRGGAKTQPSEKFFNATAPGDRRLTNSDLAFTGNYVIQGNYSGVQV